MYQVSITGYRLAEESHGKPYYAYCIEVLEPNSGIQYFIEKRYSEFNSLHRTLKKEVADIAPFPPKRVRNSQPKVLEQRRVALELYIQTMLRISATKQQVLNFLGIDGRATGVSHRRMQKSEVGAKDAPSNTLDHHPVLSFNCDPYIQTETKTSLPDIVTSGVLLGIYKTS
ncbi:sorting nexin-24-like [Prorops nasuta]|uniref:sorting nexin-24-like n=1 Tax=Prorops nasuta TaxID=863751 RepID=UPI0034CE217B